MGSIDVSIICPVDEKKAELCPGYFGKIDLALPVFNHHFIPYVEKILKCVCFRCSNLLLDKTDPNILKELNLPYNEEVLRLLKKYKSEYMCIWNKLDNEQEKMLGYLPFDNNNFFRTKYNNF